MAVVNPWSHPADWSNGIPPEIHPPDAEVLTLLLNKVKRRGMVVAEVGSWVGNGSTRVIAEHIRAVDGVLYCIDTWAGSDNVEHHRQFRDRYNSMFTIFSDNVRKYHARQIVKPLVMSSVEASKFFPDESIDLLFLDGNHGYTHVKQDLLAWLPKIKFGGILCGHDCDASYRDLCPGLRDEIENQCEQDVFTNSRHPGPPAFHAGVVKAVHEVLGNKATLWFKVKPSTIWSYRRTRGMIGWVRALVRKHAAHFQGGGSLDQRPLPTPAPWPVCDDLALESQPQGVC